MSRSKRERRGGGERLVIVTRVLLVAGAMVGLATSAVVFNFWRVALMAGEYVEAVFVVDRVEFRDLGMNKQRRRVPTAWGTVGGKEEEISLVGFEFEAETTEELRVEFPAGAEIEIWYDEGAADVYTQSKTLKVLPGSTDFGQVGVKAVGVTLLCYGMLMAGGGCWWVCRRRGVKVF